MSAREINPMCFDCKTYGNGCDGTNVMAYTGCIYKVQDETKKGMLYVERNPLWNLNSKIRAKFSRLNHLPVEYIYVGLLPTATGWTRRDFIDIMSYYEGCIGFQEVSEEEVKQFAVIPTGDYVTFLKLEKAKKVRKQEEEADA